MILSAPSDIWMQSHGKTIDDLPNELLYLVLGNLDLEELIPVGCVSRKFNILAFTFYFGLVQRSGLAFNMLSAHYTFDNTPYPPGTSPVGRNQRHPFCTLSALRLSILIKQPVASVAASFDSARFLEEADQLQKYLHTAPELAGVRLTLPTPGALYHRYMEVSNEAKEEQYRALCHVLEGLRTVTPHMIGLSWTVSGDIAIPDDAAPYTGAPLTNVHSVVLQECPVFFSPPLKDWTIASLHQSQVQSLEIDAKFLAPHHDSIHLPHLLNLKIRAFSASAVSFSLGTFLSRHPSLRTVLFLNDKEAGGGGFNYHLEDNALPNVTTVSAPIENLILWLSNASALSKVSTVNARNCIAMTPANFGNVVAPEQLSVGCALTRELLTLVAQRRTISSFLFPICELRGGGDIFPAELDLSHVRALHCTPDYQFEMTAEAAEDIGAMLVGFTGLERIVVNQSRRRHAGWNENMGPKLREGICLQLVG